MTDPLQSLPQTVDQLNALPLSKQVANLFEQSRQQPESGLLLSSLALWALENSPVSETWAEAVEEALAMAMDDPQALYWNLQSPELEQATSLRAAARAVLSRVADLVPADSQAP